MQFMAYFANQICNDLILAIPINQRYKFCDLIWCVPFIELGNWSIVVGNGYGIYSGYMLVHAIKADRVIFGYGLETDG